MQYLEWYVIKRSNTRSCSYAKRDMIAALERCGCNVQPHPTASMLLLVKRPLSPGESPGDARKSVEQRIRIVHNKAGFRFEGLKEQDVEPGQA